MSFQILPSSLAIDLIAIFFIGAALSGALLIAFISSIGAALLIIGAAILAIIGGGAIAISYYGYPGGGGIILYLSSALSISLRFLSFSSLSMD